MRFIVLRKNLHLIILGAAILSSLALSGGRASAQSTDVDAPSPVRADTISGRIAALDVGDARLTRHFYRFSGRQGDLVVTVESENLNGGVDLFTANGLRPLAQFVIFAAGQTPSRATKSVYLRQPEELILRVEARSPNDDAGSYRIKFEGAFEAAQGGATDGESSSDLASDSSATQPGGRSGNTRRVTSVGGRVAPDETARGEEAPTTANAPDDAPTTPPSAETPPPAEEPTPAAPAARRGTAQPRGRRGASPRTAAPPRRTTRRRSAPSTARTTTPTTRTATPDAPPAQPAAGPRLIVETRDGARLERPMSSVRRVTVDNNQLVIILNDGKVERQAMANVLRFSIEP